MPTMTAAPMRIDSCDLFFLRIPLRVSFSHGARADRLFSDSVIVRISSEDRCGHGEAVVRDYVSGVASEDFPRLAPQVVGRLLAPLGGRVLTWSALAPYLAGLATARPELPFLCAVETALIDLCCRCEGKDIYDLLGLEPRRDPVRYGGIIPILSSEDAENLLRLCRKLELPNAKIKVNGDADLAASVLALSRNILGEAFDIRVDANSSWPPCDAARFFDTCRRYAVKIVEQPFADAEEGAVEAMREARAAGFQIMADEGALRFEDIRLLADAGAYSLVNLRLSKNGGLAKVLALAEEARRCGLSYQLGCMVGETGVLSAVGRAAAALLPSPRYLEGSYDDALLTENITTASMGFGARGEAPVIRGRGAGYEISGENLERLSHTRVRCL
jgi:L-Ala-D/L-Glu epimerase